MPIDRQRGEEGECVCVCVCVCVIVYYTAIKKDEIVPFAINNMGGPKEYYGRWIKSDWKRQLPYDCTHTWNLKNKWINKGGVSRGTSEIGDED